MIAQIVSIFFVMHIALLTGTDVLETHRQKKYIQGSTDYEFAFWLTLLPGHENVVTPEMHYSEQTLAPLIGYYSKDYPMRLRLALIQYNPALAIHALPGAIKTIVEPLVNKDTHIDIQALIYAEKTNAIENVVPHPWARTWTKNKITKNLYFNDTVTMGFFDVHGIKTHDIKKNPIPVDKLHDIGISVHNGKGLAFSGNVARFSVMPGRDISTTWLVALSPNKKHILITYMILVNTPEAVKKIQNITTEALTLGDLIQRLESIATTFNESDKLDLEHAAITIRNVALGSVIPPRTLSLNELLIPPLQNLEIALAELAKKLES